MEADVIREDTEKAFTVAVGKLSKKIGAQREMVMEMLEEALQGKPVVEKDPNNLLKFYAKLQSMYSMAEDTGRAGEFETRSTTDCILKKKLPHLTAKWCRKQRLSEMSFLPRTGIGNGNSDFHPRRNGIGIPHFRP